MFRRHRQVSGALLESQASSYEEMEEELTCAVCLELYADPLMLPCSHSICKICLHDIIATRAKAGKQGLECPTCRQSHTFSSDDVINLPKNLALENIIFRYQEIRSCSLSRGVSKPASSSSWDEENSDVFEENKDILYCGMCEEPDKTQADWFCEQCQVFYCHICLDAFHPKRGALSKHKVRKPTLKECVECMLHCPDHSAESATIFCDTCKVVACHLCVCKGQGSHCGHVILDLETARTQLQETLESVKLELSTLIAIFSDKNSVIYSHIQDIKDLEESAKNVITSQHSCILSDIAAALNLLKQKSFESISAITSKHRSNFTASEQHIKTALQRCQNLESVCDSLFSAKENCEEVNKASQSGTRDLQRSSSESGATGSAIIAGLCGSGDDVPGNASTLPQIKQSYQLMKFPQQEPVANEKQPQVQHRTQDELVSNKTAPNGERNPGFNRNGKAFRYDKKHTPEKKDIIAAQMFAECHTLESKTQGLDNKSISTDVKKKPMKIPRKNLKNQESQEEKAPKSKISETKPKGSRLREDEKQDSLSLPRNENFDQSLVRNNVKPDNQLLLKADLLEPVLKQVAALVKENECQESMESNELVASSFDDDDKNISACVSGFQSSCLALLNKIADHSSMDYPVITPVVRSTVSPANPGKPVVPRIQSRTLMTWGFNSTTFTAEPIEDSARWTVNINKNTSYIGDIKTGYLFGVGLSTKPMGSKEQAGMTRDSHAVACVNGQLIVCEDSVQNSVMPLTSLPASVTIAAAVSGSGVAMAYRIMMSGVDNAICGQRFITLDENTQIQGGDAMVRVYPVFTVSQRVKLQFPLLSDL